MATINNSDRLDLVKRIRALSSAFLPPSNATGTYSAAEYDRTSAFLLLSHAEIEWFLEQRCLGLLHKSVQAWSADSLPRSTIVALVAFTPSAGSSTLPETVTPGGSQIRAVVTEAKQSYSAVVAHNNGLKTANLLRLLLPMGIREHQLSTTFLADMDSFGAARGAHAHRGVGAQTPPDPGDSQRLVSRILLALRQLDVHMLKLASEGP